MGSLTPEKLIIKFSSVQTVITVLQILIPTLTRPTIKLMVLVISMEQTEVMERYI